MKEYQLQTFASSTERVRIKYIILEIAKGPAFCMKNKYSKEKYVSFTDSEKKLPLIFTIFYLAIDIIAVIVLFILI